MKAAIVSLGSRSSQMIYTEMSKYFDSVDHIDLRSVEVNLGDSVMDTLYQGSPIQRYDCIYARGSFRYAALLRSMSFAVEDACYLPIHADTFSVGHDKLLTHLALQQAKIPMPKTYITSSPGTAKRILEEIHYPIVVKFPSGTQGKGVMFAESYAAASSMLDALFTLNQQFILQEYIETGGIDIRAMVVGEKVVAAITRKAVKGEMRSNIHAGGVGESVVLDSRTRRIAVQSAQALGAEICAVDILEGPKGPVVIEVNLSPGLQGITQATGLNVADRVAKYLFEKTKEHSKKGVDDATSQILHDLGVSENEFAQQIISNIDFRGDRILLPKIVSDLSAFNENDEAMIKAEKGKVVVEKV